MLLSLNWGVFVYAVPQAGQLRQVWVTSCAAPRDHRRQSGLSGSAGHGAAHCGRLGAVCCADADRVLWELALGLSGRFEQLRTLQGDA